MAQAPFFFIVARGPVPRDRHCQDTVVLGPLGPEENKRRFFRSRTMARDRPSPYDKETFFSVARGPVPRDLHRQDAILGPLGPEENKRRFFRSTNDGEGQALALR